MHRPIFHPRDATGPTTRPSRRSQYALYAVGLLTDGQSDLIGLIIPLWAIALGLGPLELGILISAKGILPSLLAIHGGVLMDRYGTWLMLFLMGAACTLIPPLFAIVTWFPALFLLQMALGLAMSFAWMGAQSLAIIVSRNDTVILGRFSFFARIGVMVAPVIAGALWDYAPHWVAFLAVAAAGAAYWQAVRLLPRAEIDGPPPTEHEKAKQPPFRFMDLMPRLSDYIGAIGLLVIPAVAYVVVVSSVRLGSALMQQSFYIVYLQEIGLQATVIGLFIALSQALAAVGTLTAGRLVRWVHPNWVFLGSVSLSVFFVYSTPLYGDALAVLAVAIAIRGLCQGISQPVMYNILSLAVTRETQATSIGLRQTGNRIATLTIPILMGAIAEVWGLDATFYVTGLLLLTVCAVMGVWVALGKSVRKPSP